MFEKPEFGMRVAQLRLSQDEQISARDMSLSIGQSEGYISSIENGHNYPSMEAFFYICDFLKITPVEFFDTQQKDPRRVNRLLEAARGLDSEQLDHLIAIARDLKRR
ncbi:helix-turn-helix transcriptional regulator [Pseudoflavonifractor sp. 60]|uniref:helix-turn-helix domain-containing protein n=1 Tax=Pseudoflavonifractor sp. 60 TaxID=2304576 RepID=UPI00325B0FD2